MHQGKRVTQQFQPVFDSNSKILILGTFPSVKSRENHFYYGHPQNRFWKVLAYLLKENIPVTIQEKKKLLLSHGVALWDVVESCEIVGSSDSSIRNVIPADISIILNACRIHRIFANGRTAEMLYNRYLINMSGQAIRRLPSTSPANAAYSLERLIKEWEVITEIKK